MLTPALPPPALRCSEEDADKAHRRIQRLRAFHFGASQFVGALQAFLHARTAGGLPILDGLSLAVVSWGACREGSLLLFGSTN